MPMKTIFPWLVVVILTVAAAVEAQESTNEVKPDIAPPSSWVKPQFFDQNALAYVPPDSIDQHWLLLERQINVASNETFIHGMRQILSVSGIQNGSDLKIDFNPVYQKLTLHWVRLWRGTNHLNQLTADKIRMVRQERGLDDEQIIDGEQTAVLLMEDVREGDIVDYAYSVTGDNPVLGGKFSTSFHLEANDPIDRLMTRVVWPATRRLYPKTFGSDIQPLIVRKDNQIECVWDERQLPGMMVEDMLPEWFDPLPWLQLSESTSWAEVDQWAWRLFQAPAKLSPELNQKVLAWQQLPDREQQVLAALRFVQDEVRYFGVEIGESAERPTDPAIVAARRFGDCKDKSLLFVTLLHAMGIEAYPVLVNTQMRQTIADCLPSAELFDHCIAVVCLNGRNWWLDPTAGYQRGSLDAHFLDAYGWGLVITPRTTALAPIQPAQGQPLTTTTENFELHKREGATELNVVTLAEGRDADELRGLFATTKRSELERTYLHYYSEAYPGTEIASPLEITDDEAQNHFQITEHYTIGEAWVKTDRDNRYHCDFFPSALATYLKKPADNERKQPLAIRFPEHQILQTEITAPTGLDFSPENKTVNDPAFYFHKQTQRSGNKLILQYEYQSLADSVPPERADEYLKNLDTAVKSLGNGYLWR